MNRNLLFCLPLLLLSACSDDKPKEQELETPPNYGVFKHQMDTLEDARGLEKQLQQDAKTRDQQLRDMGG